MKSSKSNMAALVLGMAAMMSVGTSRSSIGDEVLENLTDSKPKKVIPPNHKEFTIRGITVTALSHKRAIEKVSKILASKKYQDE